MGEGERSCSTAQRGVRGTVREGVNRKSGILFSFQLLLIDECNVERGAPSRYPSALPCSKWTLKRHLRMCLV